MKAQQVICELPSEDTDSSVRVVLHTRGQAPPINFVRRGNDIFFLSGRSEIIAAFVRVDSAKAAV